MSFRKIIFWIHLIVGISAGLVIGVMCFTGTTLAFEKQIVAWAEHDARQVPLTAPAPRLPLDELQRKFREAAPGGWALAITITTNARDAVIFSVDREGPYYLNPYTGEVRQPASTKVRDFLRRMTDLHRWLALSADGRPTGKAITGACNLGFLFLAVSGLFLWWPRKWRTKGLKRSLWFLRGASGHARDWNWHNVIGFWFLPVLIVLTASGVVLSYKWAGDLVYRVAGEAPPLSGGGPRAPAAAPNQMSAVAPGARPLDCDALFALAQKLAPHWETITLRPGGGPRGDAPANPSPVNIVIKESGAWPRTATTSFSIDPFTGDLLKREGFAELTPGRQARLWLRFLHTGEALGFTGQFIAGLACLGGCLLVYTGFALAWRRFFGPPRQKTP